MQTLKRKNQKKTLKKRNQKKRNQKKTLKKRRRNDYSISEFGWVRLLCVNRSSVYSLQSDIDFILSPYTVLSGHDTQVSFILCLSFFFVLLFSLSLSLSLSPSLSRHIPFTSFRLFLCSLISSLSRSHSLTLSLTLFLSCFRFFNFFLIGQHKMVDILWTSFLWLSN